VGPQGNVSSGSRLELTLADRNEHYSDFGSTNNPKVGLAWRPLSALKVRGTYGTSFVAPLLKDLNPIPDEVAAFNTSQAPGSAPLTGGDINALVIFGGNPNLQPQTAKTWTFGLDWDGNGGFKANLTYFDVEYSDRISKVDSQYQTFFTLPLANILGPKIIQFSPPAALVQALVASPTFM